MSQFGEILAEFKKTEDPENIIPLVEEESLRSGLVAWKSVTIEHKEGLKECPYKDSNSRWNWLWTTVDYDVNHFGIVAGVKQQDAVQLIRRLMGLRLIYPDGTINDFAKKYLQSIIMAKLKKST